MSVLSVFCVFLPSVTFCVPFSSLDSLFCYFWCLVVLGLVSKPKTKLLGCSSFCFSSSSRLKCPVHSFLSSPILEAFLWCRTCRVDEIRDRHLSIIVLHVSVHSFLLLWRFCFHAVSFGTFRLSSFTFDCVFGLAELTLQQYPASEPAVSRQSLRQKRLIFKHTVLVS
jgi:hypothetical protein